MPGGWAEPGTVEALGPALARLEARFGPAVPVILAPGGLTPWFEAFRVCQAAEVWEAHRDWVEQARPSFGPGVADRFRMAAGIGAEAWAGAREARGHIRARMESLLSDGSVLILPTSPGPAPLRDADNAALDDFRTRALHLLCPAGLAGFPQISVPGGVSQKAPVGLGLVGHAGTDRMLVKAVTEAGL